MDSAVWFTPGTKDEDGSVMPYVEHVVKHEFTEETPFLGAIQLTDEVKEIVLSVIGKKKFDWKVRFRNQLNDPQLNPNDYINLESPSTVEVRRLLSACQWAVSLRDLKEWEKWVIFDTIKDIQDEDDMEIVWLETIDTEIEHAIKNPAGSENQKLQQVFEQFKTTCCERVKNCDKMHFFIGEWDYVAGDLSHTGIHVIAMPDYNPEQKKLFTGYINDSILAEFKSKESFISRDPDINDNQIQYCAKYLTALKNTLAWNTPQHIIEDEN